MKIIIIDGQGGKMGRMIVEAIKDITTQHELIVIGTNSIATAAMLKAGAKKGATGENPILVNCRNANLIIGPIGIIVTDALLGEVSEKMASAISSSTAKKILIPISKCNQVVVGVQDLPLNEYIELVKKEVEKELAKC